MTRLFAFIWMAALAFAASFILVLLWGSNDTKMHYPQNYASAMGSNIVFIGSSLTGSALPAAESADGLLEDGRSSVIVSVNGISEQFSNKLLADAIDAGTETIILEINAYAHDYRNFAEPVFLGTIVQVMRGTGKRLTIIVKALLNLGQNPSSIVQLGSHETEGILDAKQLQPNDFYRFQKIEPIYGDELQAQLTRARDAKVEVIFFSPPRPQSLVNMIGKDEFADLLAHLDHIAALYDVPLWYAPIPWPDDHFMDIMAHANVRGRIRFQKELVQWYRARQ